MHKAANVTVYTTVCNTHTQCKISSAVHIKTNMPNPVLFLHSKGNHTTNHSTEERKTRKLGSKGWRDGENNKKDRK